MERHRAQSWLVSQDQRRTALRPSSAHPRPGRTRLVGLLAAACIATGGCAASGPSARTESSAQAAHPMTPAQIAARSTPAVVTIRSDDSLGTGFLVRDNGWIATNFHVIAGADELTVVLADQSEHPVLEVLAVDEERDLAVIRIHAPRKLPRLSLGDSRTVRPGDPVVAIGHPLGLEDTISNGLVSAIRVIDRDLTLLQISAPIAPGSSGGPLFNDHGEVIGIAAAVSTEGQNLNFGVPATYLQTLLSHPAPVPLSEFASANPDDSSGGGLAFPEVKRAVPHHAIALLSGCSEADLRGLAKRMDGAIRVGAELYNQGDFASCYHVYEGAAVDMEHRLGASCRGPKQALSEGRRKASELDDGAEQAWAMRDAFDGLLDVILRKVHGARD